MSYLLHPVREQRRGLTYICIVMVQDLAVGVMGIRILNKETHMAINSSFLANLYYNQFVEWSNDSKGIKLVIEESTGGLQRTIELLTPSVRKALIPSVESLLIRKYLLSEGH